MKYKATPQTISRVVDDEVIALNLSTGQYYTMNEVGTRVWLLLEQEESTASIVETIVSEFNGPVQKISEDVAAFLKDLEACDMIVEVK